MQCKDVGSLNETDQTVLGFNALPQLISQHQAMIKNQRRQEKGTENGGKSSVQNFKDKYNIYN